MSYIDRFSIVILQFLSMEPLKSHYQREIARELGVSVGKTNQVLRVLEQEEIVLKERRGRVDLYRYNLRNPVARYLKILFILSELSDVIRRLRNSSDRIILFGSCADGTDSVESDIDLLILTSDKNELEKIIRSARRSIDRRISPIILNHIEFSELRDRDQAFYEQVSRGITLWQGEE
ncbi:MAG: nucleotidyltransferase domain-containing protein [Thaumarchaeota archaeon]|nr:nucleotidyltransferase domain-containing protein [Nitrososphaerota archaeon]